jgi:hypothetical protein
MLGLWILTVQVWSEEAQSAVKPGPRGPTGPDVPLTKSEEALFAKRVTVDGKSAAAVQAACERAVKDGARVVFLPAGEYGLDDEVRVPGGVTLLGEGSGTIVRTANRKMIMFRVEGGLVRFTRMKLQGADTTRNLDNRTTGVSVIRKKNVRVDHCEILGFSCAVNLTDESTGQVDHCSIHHNLRDGWGYGVVAVAGAYALVMDSEFLQNRHSFSSNGALDWRDLKPGETRLHKAGFRKTHWEFIHNRVGSSDLSEYQLGSVDIHPGMDGTFVVEGNLFENMRHATGLMDGSGIIRGNLFRDLKGYQPAAVWLFYGTHNGNPVENAVPHDIAIAENTFLGTFDSGIVFVPPGKQRLSAKYRFGGPVENITIDGKLVPETRKDRGAPPPIPCLHAMGDDGILKWDETRTAATGVGSVAGTVTDEAGKPVPEAAVIIGERSATTDAAGSFAFAEVSEAAGFVVVGKAGCEPALAGVRVVPGRAAEIAVRLGPDRTPPAFANVRTNDLKPASATIVCEMSEPATVDMEYGQEGGERQKCEAGESAASRRVPLANLRPNTNYRVWIKAKDAAGNEAPIREFAFSTPPNADPKPPVGWGFYLGSGKAFWGRTPDEAHAGKFSAFLKGLEVAGGALNVALIAGDSNGYSGAKAYPAEAGTKYRYSFWAKGDFKEVQFAIMTWKTETADKDAREVAPISKLYPTEKWAEYKGEFEMPAGARKFVLMFQGQLKEAGGDKLGVLFVDDVEANAGAANVVVNGGAENE